MIDPYNDKPSSSGSLLVNATTLSTITLKWAKAGYQVNIHAIGDLANRNAIDAFETALKALCPDSDLSECQGKHHRFRIEHSQIVHPHDQLRMAELGIIPSIQPTHATSDMGYAEMRLGTARTKNEAYRMRSFLSLRPFQLSQQTSLKAYTQRLRDVVHILVLTPVVARRDGIRKRQSPWKTR
jgi:predicted amidohydrolase YtcJ